MKSRYRITYWKHIPTMVIAMGEGREVKVELPARFLRAIDAYAMATGLSGTEEYLAQWRRGPWLEREGTPEEVARAVAAELEAEFKTIEIPKRKV